MSSAQPSTPVAAAAASSRPIKEPSRHFWEGPDPADEGDEEKQRQGAEHASPVARLYRHALESVFAFLTLRDLGRVLSVSRSWSSSVRTMKSIAAAVVDPKERCWRIAASPLGRHVSRIVGLEDEDGSTKRAHLTGGDLCILSRHLPWLTSLSCAVAPRAGLLFGLSLQTLNLRLLGSVGEEQDAAAIIVTISQLPQLTDLALLVPLYWPSVSIAPLASAARLRDLKLDTVSWSQPTPQHVDQLRAMPHLRRMAIPGLSSSLLAVLLRTPHLLQWQELHRLDGVDDSAAAALSTLPTLTKLDTYDCSSVAFLPALTRLRSLDLHVAYSVHLAADIVAGLGCCPQLTELRMRAEDVTAKHMSQILPRLPLLSSLTLYACTALSSLSFLSDCPNVAQSLDSLQFCEIGEPVHSVDLQHILTLKNLTTLYIVCVFLEPLDAATQRMLTPPSVVLPKLKHFTYRH